jgi:hypothetical protein
LMMMNFSGKKLQWMVDWVDGNWNDTIYRWQKTSPLILNQLQ